MQTVTNQKYFVNCPCEQGQCTKYTELMYYIEKNHTRAVKGQIQAGREGQRFLFYISQTCQSMQLPQACGSCHALWWTVAYIQSKSMKLPPVSTVRPRPVGTWICMPETSLSLSLFLGVRRPALNNISIVKRVDRQWNATPHFCYSDCCCCCCDRGWWRR